MKIVITKFPDVPTEELQTDLGRTLLMLFAQSGLMQDGMRISFLADDDKLTLGNIEQAILELNGGFTGGQFTWGNLTERAEDLLKALRKQGVPI